MLTPSRSAASATLTAPGVYGPGWHSVGVADPLDGLGGERPAQPATVPGGVECAAATERHEIVPLVLLVTFAAYPQNEGIFAHQRMTIGPCVHLRPLPPR